MPIETGTPVFQTKPKETSWTGSTHSDGSRWRSASAASPSPSGSRSRQGSSGWPPAGSGLQRDAADDPQIPQHDAGGRTPGRDPWRALPLQAACARRVCGPNPRLERKNHRQVERRQARPRGRRRQTTQEKIGPCLARVQKLVLWRGQARIMPAGGK